MVEVASLLPGLIAHTAVVRQPRIAHINRRITDPTLTKVENAGDATRPNVEQEMTGVEITMHQHRHEGKMSWIVYEGVEGVTDRYSLIGCYQRIYLFAHRSVQGLVVRAPGARCVRRHTQLRRPSDRKPMQCCDEITDERLPPGGIPDMGV